MSAFTMSAIVTVLWTRTGEKDWSAIVSAISTATSPKQSEIQEAALALCSYLIANDLFLFDINLKNIVLRRMPDNSCRAYAIDLKGPYDNKEFLQLSSRIKFFGRKKLKRRSQQLLERIVQFREQRELLKKSVK
jgi:hypothetical protein